jgi:hypothetical protein
MPAQMAVFAASGNPSLFRFDAKAAAAFAIRLEVLRPLLSRQA